MVMVMKRQRPDRRVTTFVDTMMRSIDEHVDDLAWHELLSGGVGLTPDSVRRIRRQLKWHAMQELAAGRYGYFEEPEKPAKPEPPY